MSWRIEDSDALTVLRELPSGWAQSCVTRPPRDGRSRRCSPYWRRLVASCAATARYGSRSRPAGPHRRRSAIYKTRLGSMLGAASPSVCPVAFCFSPSSPSTSFTRGQHSGAWPSGGSLRELGHRVEAASVVRSPRRAFCVAAPGIGGSPRREVIEWCVLASTVTRACGVCGAPWQPVGSVASRWERSRRVCVHTNGRGRSLVIDPFCESATAALVTQLRGRDFLGIAQSPDAAASIRRRLMLADREARR